MIFSYMLESIQNIVLVVIISFIFLLVVNVKCRKGMSTYSSFPIFYCGIIDIDKLHKLKEPNLISLMSFNM